MSKGPEPRARPAEHLLNAALNNKFKLTPVDEVSWPHLRGVKTLKEFFRDYNQAERLTHVYSAPGHIALVLKALDHSTSGTPSFSRWHKPGSTLWLLDACSKSSPNRLSESQLPVLKNILFGTSSLFISEVVLTTMDSTILTVQFFNFSEHLFVVVVEENLSVHIWEWIPEKYLWHFRQRYHMRDSVAKAEVAVVIPSLSKDQIKISVFWMESSSTPSSSSSSASASANPPYHLYSRTGKLVPRAPGTKKNARKKDGKN